MLNSTKQQNGPSKKLVQINKIYQVEIRKIRDIRQTHNCFVDTRARPKKDPLSQKAPHLLHSSIRQLNLHSYSQNYPDKKAQTNKSFRQNCDSLKITRHPQPLNPLKLYLHTVASFKKMGSNYRYSLHDSVFFTNRTNSGIQTQKLSQKTPKSASRKNSAMHLFWCSLASTLFFLTFLDSFSTSNPVLVAQAAVTPLPAEMYANNDAASAICGSSDFNLGYNAEANHIYTVVALPFNPLAHGFAIGGMQRFLTAHQYAQMHLPAPQGADLSTQALLMVYDNMVGTAATPMQPYRTFTFETVTINQVAYRLHRIDALTIHAETDPQLLSTGSTNAKEITVMGVIKRTSSITTDVFFSYVKSTDTFKFSVPTHSPYNSGANLPQIQLKSARRGMAYANIVSNSVQMGVVMPDLTANLHHFTTSGLDHAKQLVASAELGQYHYVVTSLHKTSLSSTPNFEWYIAQFNTGTTTLTSGSSIKKLVPTNLTPASGASQEIQYLVAGETSQDKSSWFSLYGAVRSASSNKLVHISRAQITKDLTMDAYETLNIEFGASIDNANLQFLDFDLFVDSYGRPNMRATLGSTSTKNVRYITRNLIAVKKTASNFQFVSGDFHKITYSATSAWLNMMWTTGHPVTFNAYQPNFSITIAGTESKALPVLNLEAANKPGCVSSSPTAASFSQTMAVQVVSSVAAPTSVTSTASGIAVVLQHDAATWLNKPMHAEEWDPCHLSTNALLDDAISNQFYIEQGGYAKEMQVSQKAFAELCDAQQSPATLHDARLATWKLVTLAYWTYSGLPFYAFFEERQPNFLHLDPQAQTNAYNYRGSYTVYMYTVMVPPLGNKDFSLAAKHALVTRETNPGATVPKYYLQRRDACSRRSSPSSSYSWTQPGVSSSGLRKFVLGQSETVTFNHVRINDCYYTSELTVDGQTDLKQFQMAFTPDSQSRTTSTSGNIFRVNSYTAATLSWSGYNPSLLGSHTVVYTIKGLYDKVGYTYATYTITVEVISPLCTTSGITGLNSIYYTRDFWYDWSSSSSYADNGVYWSGIRSGNCRVTIDQSYTHIVEPASEFDFGSGVKAWLENDLRYDCSTYNCINNLQYSDSDPRTQIVSASTDIRFWYRFYNVRSYAMRINNSYYSYKIRLVDSQGNEAFTKFRVRWSAYGCSFNYNYVHVSDKVYTIGAGMTEKSFDEYGDHCSGSDYYRHTRWTLTYADGQPFDSNLFYYTFNQNSGNSHPKKRMVVRVRGGINDSYAGEYNFRVTETNLEGSNSRSSTFKITLQTKCDYVENKSIAVPTTVDIIQGRSDNVIDISGTNLGSCYYMVKLSVDNLLNNSGTTGIVLNNASFSTITSIRPDHKRINTPYTINMNGVLLAEGPHILRVDVFRDSSATDRAFEMIYNLRVLNSPCLEGIVLPPIPNVTVFVQMGQPLYTYVFDQASTNPITNGDCQFTVTERVNPAATQLNQLFFGAFEQDLSMTMLAPTFTQKTAAESRYPWTDARVVNINRYLSFTFNTQQITLTNSKVPTKAEFQITVTSAKPPMPGQTLPMSQTFIMSVQTVYCDPRYNLHPTQLQQITLDQVEFAASPVELTIKLQNNSPHCAVTAMTHAYGTVTECDWSAQTKTKFVTIAATQPADGSYKLSFAGGLQKRDATKPMTCKVMFTEKLTPQQTGETGRPEHVTTVTLNLVNRCKQCALTGITADNVKTTQYDPQTYKFKMSWSDFRVRADASQQFRVSDDSCFRYCAQEMVSVPTIKVNNLDVLPYQYKMDIVARSVEITVPKPLETNSTVIFTVKKRLANVYPAVETESVITKDLIWYLPGTDPAEIATAADGTSTTSTTTTTNTNPDLPSGTVVIGNKIVDEAVAQELDTLKTKDADDLTAAEKELLVENANTGYIDPTKLKDVTVTELEAREEAIVREKAKEEKRQEDLFRDINRARKAEGLPPLTKEEFIARQKRGPPKGPEPATATTDGTTDPNASSSPTTSEETTDGQTGAATTDGETTDSNNATLEDDPNAADTPLSTLENPEDLPTDDKPAETEEEKRLREAKERRKKKEALRPKKEIQEDGSVVFKYKDRPPIKVNIETLDGTETQFVSEPPKPLPKLTEWEPKIVIAPDFAKLNAEAINTFKSPLTTTSTSATGPPTTGGSSTRDGKDSDKDKPAKDLIEEEKKEEDKPEPLKIGEVQTRESGKTGMDFKNPVIVPPHFLPKTVDSTGKPLTDIDRRRLQIEDPNDSQEVNIRDVFSVKFVGVEDNVNSDALLDNIEDIKFSKFTDKVVEIDVIFKDPSLVSQDVQAQDMIEISIEKPEIFIDKETGLTLPVGTKIIAKLPPQMDKQTFENVKGFKEKSSSNMRTLTGAHLGFNLLLAGSIKQFWAFVNVAQLIVFFRQFKINLDPFADRFIEQLQKLAFFQVIDFGVVNEYAQRKINGQTTGVLDLCPDDEEPDDLCQYLLAQETGEDLNDGINLASETAEELGETQNFVQKETRPPQNPNETIKPDEVRLGSTSTIKNAGIFFIYGIVLAVVLILLALGAVFLRNYPGAMKLMQKVKDKLFFNYLIRFCLQSSLKFQIASAAAITMLSVEGFEGDALIGVSIVPAMIIAFYQLLPFVFYGIITANKDKIDDPRVQSNIGELFRGLDSSSNMMSLSYNVIFLVRRNIFVLTMFILFNQPAVALLAFLIQSVLYTSYLLMYPIFTNKATLYNELVNEGIFFVICYHFVLFANMVDDTDIRKALGVSLVALLIFLVASNTLVIGITSLKGCMKKSRKVYAKKMKSEKSNEFNKLEKLFDAAKKVTDLYYGHEKSPMQQSETVEALNKLQQRLTYQLHSEIGDLDQWVDKKIDSQTYWKIHNYFASIYDEMHDYAHYQDQKYDIKIVRHPKTGKPILARELEESLNLGKEAEISYNKRRVEDGVATLHEIVEEQNEDWDESKANNMALRQSTNQRLMDKIKNTTGKRIIKIIKKARKKTNDVLSVTTSVEMANLSAMKKKEKLSELNEDTEDEGRSSSAKKNLLSRQKTNLTSNLDSETTTPLGLYNPTEDEDEPQDGEALDKANQILTLLRAVIILDDLSTKRENYSFFSDLVKRMKKADVKRREDAIKQKANESQNQLLNSQPVRYISPKKKSQGDVLIDEMLY